MPDPRKTTTTKRLPLTGAPAAGPLTPLRVECRLWTRSKDDPSLRRRRSNLSHHGERPETDVYENDTRCGQTGKNC